MRCPRCNHEDVAGQKFCGECGAPLAAVCGSCGAQHTPGQKFCGECGARLGAEAAQPKFASPQAYTPKHLADKILTSKSALEGERKQVTVLFADLKSSMELLVDRDPEEARKLLDPVLERMMEAVHRYDGTVNQVMGDGIMALFGAPLAQEDHAVRACYAALAMQGTIRRYAEEQRQAHGVAIRVRVGLNSGEVVVRAIGSDLRMDYSAVGQTTHLASRMEQLADPGSILLTAGTLRLAEGFVQVRALGPVPVKGLNEPVEVYELTGASPTRTRLQAAAARGLTHFVGREAELAVLAQATARASDGHGQVVAVVGEPGVGKSRLAWEFTHSHRTRDWLVLESASVSYGKASTWRPVIDLLKSYLQIEDRDDARRIREKLTGKLLTLDRQLEPLIAPLLSLLDVLLEDAQWDRLDPPQRRSRILEACKQLLLRESRVKPLVVVFEDLHWLDNETQAFLDSLVDSLPAARVLLLVNYRPEYQHGWSSKSYYTQIRVDPLSERNAEELLDWLLGKHSSLAQLRGTLIEHTAGNPFFLEESVRTLVETGVLAGERGACRLLKPVEAIDVPATVRAMLAARIDRLPAEDKRLLQVASVIGKDVPLLLLKAIAEVGEEPLRASLGRLQAGEFLYETRLFPDLEYTFKHALTHEVAYGGILHQRRQALHAAIVETVERQYADRLEEQVEALANHAFRGELWDKALSYLRRAGARAAARSAHREAVAHLERALAAAERLPQHAETLRTLIDLRLELRSSLYPLGEHERISHHLRAGVQLASQLGDHLRVGSMLAFQAHIAWSTGEPLRAIELAERVLTTGEAEHEPALIALGTVFLGQACHSHGDYSRGIRTLSPIVERMRGDLEGERYGMALPISVVARVWLALCHAELGEFAAATVRASEAVRISDALGQLPYSDFHARWGLAVVHLLKGELGPATAGLERALSVARDGGLFLMAAAAQIYAGYAHLLRGDVAQALSTLQDAATLGGRIGHLAFHLHGAALLAEARSVSGETQEGERLALQALELSRQHHQRGYEAHALRILGESFTARASPDLERAASWYTEALALAGELGMHPLVARCHLGLGGLYIRAGERTLAQKHLVTAATMFRDLGMQFWLEKAEAALAGR